MNGVRNVTIHIGGVYASATPTLVRTVLGSCISVGLYDEHVGVGGMNHFLLPSAGTDASLPTRYGVNAMEVLINALMRRGAERSRLRAKVFGGVFVLGFTPAASTAAEENVRFVERFLATEEIRVVGRCLGGRKPLQVRFETQGGRAFVRLLGALRPDELLGNEERFRMRIQREMRSSAARRVTLF